MGNQRETDREMAFRAAVEDLGRQDTGSLAYSVVEATLTLWAEVLDVGGRYLVPAGDNSRLTRDEAASSTLVNAMDQDKIDTVVQQCRSVDVRDEKAVLGFARMALAVLQGELRLSERPRDVVPPIATSAGIREESRPYITGWRARVQVLQETLRTLNMLAEVEARAEGVYQAVRDAQKDAKHARAEVEGARTELQKVHAEAAKNELATQFAALGSREHKTSTALRWIAYGLAGAAAVVGGLISTVGNWATALAHIAVVTALGGLSAYTARLAAGHRANGDWATAVVVQLETFQGFLGVIDDADARTRVYEEFGRRVLGAPPGGGSPGQEPGTMPTAQLLELVHIISAAQRATPRQ